MGEISRFPLKPITWNCAVECIRLSTGKRETRQMVAHTVNVLEAADFCVEQMEKVGASVVQVHVTVLGAKNGTTVKVQNGVVVATGAMPQTAPALPPPAPAKPPAPKVDPFPLTYFTKHKAVPTIHYNTIGETDD